VVKKKHNGVPKKPHTPEEQVAWASGMLLRCTQDAEGVVSMLRAAMGALDLATKPGVTIVPAPRQLTAEERERERYGDFDGMADVLMDLLRLNAEARVVVLRRVADQLSLQARFARGQAAARPSSQHGIEDPYKGYLPELRDRTGG